MTLLDDTGVELLWLRLDDVMYELELDSTHEECEYGGGTAHELEEATDEDDPHPLPQLSPPHDELWS